MTVHDKMIIQHKSWEILLVRNTANTQAVNTAHLNYQVNLKSNMMSKHISTTYFIYFCRCEYFISYYGTSLYCIMYIEFKLTN